MHTLAASVATAAISLYFREGSSDKVYHAQIVSNGDDLYAVSFQYGRRGSTLQTGNKTAVPVTLAEARKIFDKLVAEKKAKGYTEGERGVPYSGGELANRQFEYTPQLLNFIDEHAMLESLCHPDWFMQEKMDGVRQIVECRAGVVTAGNRNGLTVAVSLAIVQAVFALGHDCVLDGEAIGDVYWPFDLLSFDGRDITERSATYRLHLLTATLKAKPSEALRRVRSAFTEQEKRALLETIKTEQAKASSSRMRMRGMLPADRLPAETRSSISSQPPPPAPSSLTIAASAASWSPYTTTTTTLLPFVRSSRSVTSRFHRIATSRRRAA